MIQAIAFDFDGVLVETDALKNDAMAVLFEPYGKEIQEKALTHHRRYGGISRYEKIAYYHSAFLHAPLSPEALEEKCQQFSRLVVQGVIESSWVPGALEFLAQNTRPSFIISGTPESELLYIVQQRKMERFFRGVYGSPVKKPVTLQRILKENGWKPKELLFIGDSLSDYEAATEVGVPFIGRISNPVTPFEGLPRVDHIIKDLHPLGSLLRLYS
jgi:HAD superfamily hydrolase (TIGR01549 family)